LQGISATDTVCYEFSLLLLDVSCVKLLCVKRHKLSINTYFGLILIWDRILELNFFNQFSEFKFLAKSANEIFKLKLPNQIAN